jgi:DNA repair protein RadC
MNYSVAMVQLPLVREAAGERITTPADAWRICSDMGSLAQESLHVLTLNARNRLINRHMVSLGLADASLTHPRETFRAAISDGASAVVIIHNHPSGDTTPSAEDIRITRTLVEAGKILDITVMDHVIIGREIAGVGGQPARPGFLSMRENGLCNFT